MGALREWFAHRLGTKSDFGILQQYLQFLNGAEASSGVIVNQTTAMQQTAVYSCINVLSQSVGQLDIGCYKGNEKGKEPDDGDGLLNLLRYQPNDYQTSTEFWEMMVAHLNLRGNAYAYVNRASKGRVVEIIPMSPDTITVEQVGSSLVYRGQQANGGMHTFNQGSYPDLWHVRGLTLNGYQGVSPISYNREAIGLAIATTQHGSRLFRNGAKMGGILQHPGNLSKEALERLKMQFDAASNGENAHKTLITEEGMKFEKISMTPEDAQFLETRKMQNSQIASIFRVPLHMIGDLEHATFSNIEQQSLDFVRFSLMPWLRRIELSARRCLFTDQQRAAGLFVKFDAAEMMRGDSAARTNYYASGINAGWLTRNEAREMEDLNPLDGLDEPLRPLNMVENDEADTDLVADDAPAPPAALPAPKKPALTRVKGTP